MVICNFKSITKSSNFGSDYVIFDSPKLCRRLIGHVSLSDITSHGSKQSNAVLSSSDSICSQCIHNKASKLSSILEIDIVDPNTSPSYHLQSAIRSLKNLPRHFRPTPHDQRIELRDLCAQIFAREIIKTLNIAEASKELETGLFEEIRCSMLFNPTPPPLKLYIYLCMYSKEREREVES
ncbi:hypothetical protein LOK49_LG06G00449 [Camellia lanceoleosa]|uniref:Uncharacterized protein n=1 Tax=Camellia lanceoleosa TaxID=1840588 RepID=A0ACC0HCR5_9ERIC|nr:hypothetical protein LOK49_LG06G00449 [Camellia lanceoleosa]